MAYLKPTRSAPKPLADTYVLSYPKAGRTWLRALLGRALVDHYGLPPERVLQTEALGSMAKLPRIGFDHDRSSMLGGRSWRALDANKSAYRDSSVLLLGRDVRDTLVSAYFHATRRLGAFEGPISSFIRDERFGVDKVLTFYRQWYEARGVPRRFMFLRYESLHTDPAAALRRALEFLGAAGVPDSTLAAAIEFARFDNMRDAEAGNRFGTQILTPASIADPDSFKVRKGKVGGFREHLSADDIAWIDAAEAERGCDFTRPATTSHDPSH